MLLLLDHVVNICIISIEVFISLLLSLVVHLAAHPSLPSFRYHLCLLHLPSFGKFGTLLDCIGGQNLEVCVFLKSIPVIAYQLLVAHYPHALAAIQC